MNSKRLGTALKMAVYKAFISTMLVMMALMWYAVHAPVQYVK